MYYISVVSESNRQAGLKVNSNAVGVITAPLWRTKQHKEKAKGTFLPSVMRRKSRPGEICHSNLCLELHHNRQQVDQFNKWTKHNKTIKQKNHAKIEMEEKHTKGRKTKLWGKAIVKMCLVSSQAEMEKDEWHTPYLVSSLQPSSGKSKRVVD